MKNRLCNELARLASERYQYQCVLHGTKEEYAVPEEMIDTVRGTIAATVGNPTLVRGLTEEQVAALQRFDEIAGAIYAALPWDTDVTAKEIIESVEWQQLRKAAAECLSKFGVCLSDWERALCKN